jgi:hypothetical protein
MQRACFSVRVLPTRPEEDAHAPPAIRPVEHARGGCFDDEPAEVHTSAGAGAAEPIALHRSAASTNAIASIGTRP